MEKVRGFSSEPGFLLIPVWWHWHNCTQSAQVVPSPMPACSTDAHTTRLQLLLGSLAACPHPRLELFSFWEPTVGNLLQQEGFNPYNPVILWSLSVTCPPVLSLKTKSSSPRSWMLWGCPRALCCTGALWALLCWEHRALQVKVFTCGFACMAQGKLMDPEGWGSTSSKCCSLGFEMFTLYKLITDSCSPYDVFSKTQ